MSFDIGIHYCKNEQRREAVRTSLGSDGRPIVNGIDYLEVSSDQKTLIVHFIHNLPEQNSGALTKENVRIEAPRLRSVQAGSSLQVVPVESASSFANILTLRVNKPENFSTCTLRLIDLSANQAPPQGFDPQLSQVQFSFRVEEFNEFDCLEVPETTAEKIQPPPVIDYLAKDYASFRQLILDRLTVTMPKWRERNTADIGIMLVELLAYAGDRLSYYQDAVATEAYLGTARKRVSIRRHARMLDYPMHDGCNARTWVTIEVSADGNKVKLPGSSHQENRPGTQLFTKVDAFDSVLKSADEVNAALNAGAQVFETLHDVTLYESCNKIHFYTWGNKECKLPQGATQATLKDSDGSLTKNLQVGDVLIFEEVQGVINGELADPEHRHAVRLTSIKATQDPLFAENLVEIEWATEDALPFPLWISTVVDDKAIADVSVARGNVVLVDRGLSVKEEELDPVPASSNYRPRLEFKQLTQQGYVLDRKNQWVKFDANASASAALDWEMRDVRPCIFLWEKDKRDLYWRPQRDLLNSDRFAREFVVETEDDGHAYLRFGDNVLGKRPNPDTRLLATYRIGNGSMGNVGAEAIAHIVTDIPDLKGIITKIRNPLPAKGGTDPESIEQVRLYAPQMFRTQKRAVTEADYATVAQSYPGVSKAVATRRWTGSWYTIFITVDRQGGLPVNDEFKDKLRTFLERFRLAGHDIAIDEPRFIPLDIALTVQVAPDYFPNTVKKALQETFSNTILPDGKLGFFHPDNFTFGQPVYLSRVITTAMKITGVRSIETKRFQRWGQRPGDEIETGQIKLERLEIARLDNDPNIPENGKLDFQL